MPAFRAGQARYFCGRQFPAIETVGSRTIRADVGGTRANSAQHATPGRLDGYIGTPESDNPPTSTLGVASIFSAARW